MAIETWTLRHLDRPVAKLHVTGSDQPWLEGTVEAGEGFAQLAPLFAEEQRRADELDDVETPEWTAAYDAIRLVTRLFDPDGREAAEYLLHIDGDRARWRYEYEPFPAGDA